MNDRQQLDARKKLYCYSPVALFFVFVYFNMSSEFHILRSCFYSVAVARQLLLFFRRMSMNFAVVDTDR